MVQLRKNLELKHVAKYFKNIIYADNAVVVVNKPSGLICQSNNNPNTGTGQFDLLLHAVKWKTGLEDLPFQLHRLDKPTTGALLLATNARHAKTFSKQFHDHEIRKSYLAIVRGGRQSFEGVKSGTIDARLSQEDGRVRVDEADGSLALTGWELLGSSETVPLSLLRLTLLTGHKHQLRIHLAEGLRCPVLGDTLYSKSPPTPEILALVPPNISIERPRLSKDDGSEGSQSKELQTRTTLEERISLHSAHISMTRYQQRGSRHKKVTLGIAAPVPSDFLAVCTAAGLKHAIPPSFLSGAMEIDGAPIPLTEEIEGFGGKWFGEIGTSQKE